MGQNTQETVRLLKMSLIRRAMQHNQVHRTLTSRYLNNTSFSDTVAQILAFAGFSRTWSVEILITQIKHQRYTIAISIYSLNKQQV